MQRSTFVWPRSTKTIERIIMPQKPKVKPGIKTSKSGFQPISKEHESSEPSGRQSEDDHNRERDDNETDEKSGERN
jgi:hypothetical protein